MITPLMPDLFSRRSGICLCRPRSPNRPTGHE